MSLKVKKSVDPPKNVKQNEKIQQRKKLTKKQDSVKDTKKQDSEKDTKKQDDVIINLENGEILKAVSTFLEYFKSKDTKQLFEDSEFIQLIISLHKIPYQQRPKPFRINIPNSLHDESTDICIFVKEKAKYKELIEKTGISNVKKILSIESLRNKYDRYEARRKLAQSYDLFMCDESISLVLRRLLGKKFFQTKKFPVPIKFNSNLAKQIALARDSTFFYLNKASCLNVKIGRTDMEANKICENIITSIQKIVNHIPGKWKNIKSLNIKSSESISIPFYNNLPTLEVNEILNNEKEKKNDEEGKKNDEGKNNDEEMKDKEEKDKEEKK